MDLLSIKEAPTFYVKTPILRNYEITKLRNDEILFYGQIEIVGQEEEVRLRMCGGQGVDYARKESIRCASIILS